MDYAERIVEMAETKMLRLEMCGFIPSTAVEAAYLAGVAISEAEVGTETYNRAYGVMNEVRRMAIREGGAKC